MKKGVLQIFPNLVEAGMPPIPKDSKYMIFHYPRFVGEGKKILNGRLKTKIPECIIGKMLKSKVLSWLAVASEIARIQNKLLEEAKGAERARNKNT